MSLAIPKEVRQDLAPILDNAILDSRCEITLEVSPDLAAHIAMHRLFQCTGLHISLNDAEYEGVAHSVVDLALPHFLFYNVCQHIEKMKLDLTKPMPENVVTISDLKDECYSTLLSYRLPGRKTAVIKFVGDMTLGELYVAGKQYTEKKAQAAMRESYIDSIIGAMVRAGAGEETTVYSAID